MMNKHTISLVAFAIALVSVFTACKKNDEKNTVIGVVLSKPNAVLNVNDTLTLAFVVLPKNAANKTIAWTSGDSTIAKVKDGFVTALKEGETTITVTTEDGHKTATCKVVVNFSLGTVSFATDKTWEVGGQEWSDAVQATYCDKTSFTSTTYGFTSFFADCRSNPGYKGNLFSWEMINLYGDVLCPDGWRVPTVEDFVDLDMALGGTGSNRLDLEFVLTKYLGQWGGECGGMTADGGVLKDQGTHANYWTQTEENREMARFTKFVVEANASDDNIPDGEISIKNFNYVLKSDGHTLRCVRDK